MMWKSSTLVLCCLFYITTQAPIIPETNPLLFRRGESVEVREAIYNLEAVDRNSKSIIIDIKIDVTDANKRFNELANIVMGYHNAKVNIIQRCATQQGVASLSNEQAKKEIKLCEQRSNTTIREIDEDITETLRHATVVISHTYWEKDNCLASNKKDRDKIECINNVTRGIEEHMDKVKEEGAKDVKTIKHEVVNLNSCASEASEKYRRQAQDSNVNLMQCAGIGI